MGNEKDEIENSGFVVTKTERGYIKEFFNHMLAYGGFSFDEGTMKVWGDPSVFTPLNGLLIYYNELKKNLNKTADDVFYWLGHLYGKNSSLMLIKKFGFDKKQVSDFVNGATQDGFGYMDVEKLECTKQFFSGEVEGTNSSFAVNYRKKFGKQKSCVDSYMAGILAGGSEPLFGFNIKGTEIRCMAKGDKACYYRVDSINKPKAPVFFNKISLNEEYIRKRTAAIGQKRESKFRIFGSKQDVEFGDGRFIIKGIVGFNMASYELVLLDKIACGLLGEKKFSALKEKVASACASDTFDKTLCSKLLLTKNIQAVLDRIKLLAYGNLAVYRFQGNRIIIKNENNPYVQDQINIFGKSDKNALDTLLRVLRIAFEKYFGKKAEVKAIKTSFRESFIQVKV
jgi:predicted hydrocarbon binding protein